MMLGHDPAPLERESSFQGTVNSRVACERSTGPERTSDRRSRGRRTFVAVVSLCLMSPSPILVWWGPNFALLYNDACVPFLGESRHPRCLGAAGRGCWEELWEVVGPTLESVRATGQGARSEAFPFFVARTLPREEVYLRFTYDPMLASDGRTVDGIFSFVYGRHR